MYRTFAHNPINMQTVYLESESICDTFKFVRSHSATCEILTFAPDNSIIDWTALIERICNV